MNIGVLQADNVNPDWVATHGEYADMFEALLRGRDSELQVSRYDVVAGVYPADIAHHDGYLITGSKHGAYENLPWIEALQDFVRKAYEMQVPQVGICFGHQIIAQALGGTVEKADAGWGIGVRTVTLAPAARSLTGDSAQYRLIYSHQDQVIGVPPAGEVLGGSAHCPVSMLSIGARTLSFQGHPEFSRQYAADLYESRRGMFTDELYHDAIESLESDADAGQVADWILAFIRAPHTAGRRQS